MATINIRDYITELEEQSDSVWNIAITQKEGVADVTYRLWLGGESRDNSPTPDFINAAFDYFTGGVQNIAPKLVNRGVADAGKVIRVLPPVHPLRPELSCSGVLGCKGAGTRSEVPADAAQVTGLQPVVDQYSLWTAVDYRVRFVREPYFLLDNDSIATIDEHYYPPDGGSAVPIVAAAEWKRFTSTTRTPTGETVSASGGQMSFRTQSGVVPPNEQAYTGQPFMSLKNELVEMTWHQVPFRYLLPFTYYGDTYRPYLTEFTNCVNQLEWNGYPPGSLLYLGATPTPYKPTTPTQNQILGLLNFGQDQSMLCDLKLRFLYTAREGSDVPEPGHLLLDNKNNVPAGHNLVPRFSDRTYRYCVGGDSTNSDADRRPIFESRPFSLLFTDPLLKQQTGPL